ncbi:helix-turn-helix domain-containing protein [Falsiroseomonas selenitidurans]|uniref:Helix-turn-helix domain-containing protein n=1 Tax=Falsiroseomonas selenitidurans TaxID=2716335 RepID=A0ABX1E9H7_9PROT|nr:helix-turn-helix domain-containing protein [Falsiroseomonas selenitidurans]NKC33478.1 helix-turn-helix domain-containing protein [Falsiroseomonas selenitidurans]
MKVKLLVVGLGGNKAVGERCGVSQAAVSNWIAADAIPAEHHLVLWEMALAAKVEWTPPGAEGLRDMLRTPSATAVAA